jgi:hypothetical protein
MTKGLEQMVVRHLTRIVPGNIKNRESKIISGGLIFAVARSIAREFRKHPQYQIRRRKSQGA